MYMHARHIETYFYTEMIINTLQGKLDMFCRVLSLHLSNYMRQDHSHSAHIIAGCSSSAYRGSTQRLVTLQLLRDIFIRPLQHIDNM